MIALYFTVRVLAGAAMIAACVALLMLVLSVGAMLLVCAVVYLLVRGILRVSGVIE